MKKSAEELYSERLGRFEDAIQLKEPDRVPLFWSDGGSYFAAKYAGITTHDAFYSPEKWFAANRKMILDFEPDIYFRPHFTSGRVLELLGDKNTKWPGHGVGVDMPIQFPEEENMKAGEYDAYLNDPSGYAFNTFLPRVYENLEPLQELVPLWQFLFGGEAVKLAAEFANPGIANALNALIEAGREGEKWVAQSKGYTKEMKGLGFPEYAGTIVMSAFDQISSPLRGMRGVALDIHKQPEKILEMVEKITPMLIEKTKWHARQAGSLHVYLGIYWGADGFMPLKKFKELFWPGMLKMISGLLDAGFTVMAGFDGPHGSKMELLPELPTGNIICLFDPSDLAKAKKVIGDTHCIGVSMPPSYFQTFTPRQIIDETRKLIDIGAGGGGFIMDTSGVSEDANPEILSLCVETTKEYGVYK